MRRASKHLTKYACTKNQYRITAYRLFLVVTLASNAMSKVVADTPCPGIQPSIKAPCTWSSDQLCGFDDFSVALTKEARACLRQFVRLKQTQFIAKKKTYGRAFPECRCAPRCHPRATTCAILILDSRATTANHLSVKARASHSRTSKSATVLTESSFAILATVSSHVPWSNQAMAIHVPRLSITTVRIGSFVAPRTRLRFASQR
jgi:hypothetical protein